MRKPDWSEIQVPIPTVDEVAFRSLYQKTHSVIRTEDGWHLSVTRYQPIPQNFPQPLLHESLLLVHGFSQNRHAWTSGEFVKNLLYFGLDIHVLELRGHGKSSIALQREKSADHLPADLDYRWDIDSYFLYDLPAAIAHVKNVTGRDKVFYCGHSMGGILGYGLAGLRDDLEGLITIGAAAELGRGFPLLRLLSSFAPLLGLTLDTALGSFNFQRRARHQGRRLLAQALSVVSQRQGQRLLPTRNPEPWTFQYIPMDVWLQWLEQLLATAESSPFFHRLAQDVNWLSNPDRVRGADIRWLLRKGGEREPRKVIEQFARWVRNKELKCYRTGYDFTAGFSRIKIPMAIIFGDLDPLASVESTRSVYRAAKSEYLLWRPVKGNSHLELTMGHDIRQICYDVKNLIEYAKTHRVRMPSLPRNEGAV